MLKVQMTQLRRIAVSAGDVFHGMKATDPGFYGFGEVYFSQIHHGSIKGWKRHNSAILNFVAVHGCIQVSVCDGETRESQSFVIGPDAPGIFARLTIQPGLWVAFGGVSEGSSLLMNCSSLIHDPSEADNVALETFDWDWCACH